MDCPTEEQMVRLALAEVPGVVDLEVDLRRRRLTVLHSGAADPVLDAVAALGLGARIDGTGPLPEPPEGGAPPSRGRPAPAQRRILVTVLVLNAGMFVLELLAGLWAQSTGLLADSLDMLADATVYGIALAAVGGARGAQVRSARASGWMQLVLAGLVLVEVVRRVVVGSTPEPAVMMAVGVLALLVNVTCMVLLSRHRGDGVHMRASWIFTTNDVLANLGLILAGQLVAVTGSPWPDLLIGTTVALLVASGAWRILRMAR
jgi:Co/Zn/Cd efflux system component